MKSEDFAALVKRLKATYDKDVPFQETLNAAYAIQTFIVQNIAYAESAFRLKDSMENPGAELQECFTTVVADTVTGKTNDPAVVAFISQAVCTILKELAK